jgi:hypothetical protein
MAALTGSETVKIIGLKEFRAALKALDSQWPKELTKANKTIAQRIATEAQGDAGRYGRMTAASARSIRGTASQTAAKIAFGGSPPFALAGIMGAKRHSGWYATRGHNRSHTPQFPEWVGNAWEVGGSGGPRGVNDAIRQNRDRIVDWYGVTLGELASRAFPD